MDTRFRLLSAVSGIALSIALVGHASAKLSDVFVVEDQSNENSQSITQGSWPLVEFIARVDGAWTSESVENALRSMFGDLTREQAERLPDLLLEIRRLGLGKQIDIAAVETMGVLIADSSGLASDPDFQLSIAATLSYYANGPVLPVRVATGHRPPPIQDDLCLYDPTEPEYRLDPDCPPLGTGVATPVGPPTGTTPSGYTP